MRRVDEHPDHTSERSMLEAEERRQREDRRELEARHGPAGETGNYAVKGEDLEGIEAHRRAPTPCVAQALALSSR